MTLLVPFNDHAVSHGREIICYPNQELESACLTVGWVPSTAGAFGIGADSLASPCKRLLISTRCAEAESLGVEKKSCMGGTMHMAEHVIVT